MNNMQVMPPQCAGCAAATTGFCASLGPAAMTEICRVARGVRVRRYGHLPLREGTLMAFIVRQGLVKIIHTLTDGRQQIIDFLRSGDVLVWRENDTAFQKSVEAMSDVEICEIDLPALLDVSAHTPEVGQSLLVAAMGEIDRKNNQVMMLGRKRAEERVASFLLALSDRARAHGDASDRLRLPMSRAEIADYLGLTTETVSRAFTLLREEGLIRLPKPQEVEICHFAAIAEIAAGSGCISAK